MSHTTIFSARAYPLTGGIESFTKNLSHALRERGDDVRVVTSAIGGDAGVEIDDDGVEVVRLPAYSLMGGRLPVPKKNSAYARLFDEIVAAGTDRVLVNTRFYGHSLEGLRYAREAGAPAVVLDHGSAYLTLGNPLADKVIAAYERATTKRVKKEKPVFAGISGMSCAWLEEFGIDTGLVVPNAIDAEAFRAASSCRAFKRGAERPLVAYVGRLAPEKGPDKLVETARLVPEADFVLAGDGAMRVALEEIAPDNVRLLGNVDKADLSALLSEADAFCLPTRSEGFCTSLLEAGAWGVPSVVPDVGGAREVVGEDEFGIIVPDTKPETMAKALKELLSPDARAREDRSRRLRAHIENEHGWTSTLEGLDKAFAAGRE